MPSPPLRYVVQTHDIRKQRRRRLGLAVAWLGSLVLAAGSALILSGRKPVRNAICQEQAQVRKLSAQNDALQQQIANLQRAGQVTQIATTALRQTLAERDKKINNLRADLGFYSRLRNEHQGLKVQEIRLHSVDHTRAWNLTLSLTQSTHHHGYTTGTVTVSVVGIRNNKVVELAWSALGHDDHKKGLPFHFKYLQLLQTTILLPNDFSPSRLKIKANPSHDNHVIQAVTWHEALTGNATPAQE